MPVIKIHGSAPSLIDIDDPHVIEKVDRPTLLYLSL
jgi:hypothetical protein